jgi:NADH-quinone oxidoreductase subunit M
VTIGIFTFNVQGIQGALFQMLSHGIVSGALFLVVGVIYDRIHTRDIARYGGLADRMPLYALTFMIFTMASVGLPGTSGFVGEFLVIVGSLQVNFWLALLGATGMILGAAYMLYLYRRVIFGRLTKEDLRAILDLSPREIAVFAPLVLLTFWMGIYPSSFTGFWDASVSAMVQQHTASLTASSKLATAQPTPASAQPPPSWSQSRPPWSQLSWSGLARPPTTILPANTTSLPPTSKATDGRARPDQDETGTHL